MCVERSTLMHLLYLPIKRNCPPSKDFISKILINYPMHGCICAPSCWCWSIRVYWGHWIVDSLWIWFFLCIEDLFLYLISSTRVSIMKLEVIHVNRSRISLLITEILVVGVNSGDSVQDLYNSGDNVECKDHEILAHSFSWASSISMGWFVFNTNCH